MCDCAAITAELRAGLAAALAENTRLNAQVAGHVDAYATIVEQKQELQSRLREMTLTNDSLAKALRKRTPVT